MVFSGQNFSMFAAILLLPTSLIAQSEIKTDSPHFGEKGWDFELGIGALTFSDSIYKDDDVDGNSGVLPLINISYFDDNFHFILDREDGLLLGYTVYRQKDWAADIILSPRFEGPEDDNDTLDFLDERDPDLHAGLRWSFYGTDSRLKLEASKDISGAHNGYIVSTEYQQEWQVRNWLLTGRAGISYLSAKGVDYYLGVNSSEATVEFPSYEADAEFIYGVGIKAEYPINENWVFEATAGTGYLGSEITNSPISSGENQITGATIGAIYHF